jgi:hypothetical protein
MPVEDIKKSNTREGAKVLDRGARRGRMTGRRKEEVASLECS